MPCPWLFALKHCFGHKTNLLFIFLHADPVAGRDVFNFSVNKKCEALSTQILLCKLSPSSPCIWNYEKADVQITSIAMYLILVRIKITHILQYVGRTKEKEIWQSKFVTIFFKTCFTNSILETRRQPAGMFWNMKTSHRQTCLLCSQKISKLSAQARGIQAMLSAINKKHSKRWKSCIGNDNKNSTLTVDFLALTKDLTFYWNGWL